MNTNQDSEQYGTIKRYSDLTQEEKYSGDWKPLPDGICWGKPAGSPVLDEITTTVGVNSPHPKGPFPVINRHERRKQAKLERQKERVR